MAADNFYEIISDDYTKDILDDDNNTICTVQRFIDFITYIIETNATSDPAANPTANPTAYIQVIYKTDDTTDETLKDFIKFGYFLKEEEGKEKVYIFIKDTKIGRNIEDLKKLITAPPAATAAAEGEEEGPAATAATEGSATAVEAETPSASTTSQNQVVIDFLNGNWTAPQNGDDSKPSYEQFISNTITKIDNNKNTPTYKPILDALGGVSCNLWNYKLGQDDRFVYKPDVYKPDVQGGGASDYAPSEISMLGGDPLFLVLSEFFMSSKRGNSLADILEKINDNLEKLAKKM